MRRWLLVIALAAVFGAADQFLGARSYVVGFWATDVSLLSAPWLLIAFLAGWSQPTAKGAAILGAASTLAALVGYWAMTLSPIEGAVVTLGGVRALVVGQAAYAVGGVVTGPLFGWLGHRWSTRHDWMSALAAALVVCCEPLAHAAAGATVSFRDIWAAEVGVGLSMALYVVVAVSRRATPRASPPN
jgi:hypothetical protein